MNRNQKWMLGGVFALLALVFLIWSTIGRLTPVRGQDKDDEEERPIQAPSHVSVQNGETVVTLDAATQGRLGLTLATLRALSTRQQLRTSAVILPVDDLGGLRGADVVARSKLVKARVNVDLSRKEQERLKSLYQDDQNTSLKALEAAQAAVSTDEADADTAERELALQESAAQQRWGKVVAGWIASGSPSLGRLLDQQDLLVQVSLPPAEASPVPEAASVQMPSGAIQRATLVSSFPRLDPRIQGSSFLYLTAAHLGLTPGMNLVALLSMGQLMRGVVVPEGAVVWWQGKPWVYEQTSPERFIRREVPTDAPVEEGWFVSKRFSAGDKIVLRGAQILFSEEFRSQIQAAEEQ
jgi:hypothetical protein